jgi:hypothetical protein
MPRCIPVIVSVGVAILCSLPVLAHQDSVQFRGMSRQSVTGRLAIVQPALGVVSILPDGESTTVELVVSPEAIILEAERQMSLVDLVVEVGRVVAVEYVADANRRVATRITLVASEREAPTPTAATGSMRPR